MLAVVAEILAHGGAGKGRDVLHRGRVGGAGRDHGGVFHRPVLAQGLDHQGNGGLFLADGHVDAVHVGFFLGDDRIDAEGGLADLAVADHQLALAAADRGHRIHRLGPGVAGLMHRLPGDNAGGQHFDLAALLGGDRALAVDRLADPVHYPAQHFRADRHFRDPAGALNDVAFLDLANVAEHRATDVVRLQVEGHPEDIAGELEELHGHAVFHPVHPGDTVADRDDGAGFIQINLGFILLDLALDDLTDFFGFNLHLSLPLGVFG